MTVVQPTNPTQKIQFDWNVCLCGCVYCTNVSENTTTTLRTQLQHQLERQEVEKRREDEQQQMNKNTEEAAKTISSLEK